MTDSQRIVQWLDKQFDRDLRKDNYGRGGMRSRNEIALSLNIPRDTCLRELKSMAEKGVILRKSFSNGTWWRSKKLLPYEQPQTKKPETWRDSVNLRLTPPMEEHELENFVRGFYSEHSRMVVTRPQIERLLATIIKRNSTIVDVTSQAIIYLAEQHKRNIGSSNETKP